MPNDMQYIARVAPGEYVRVPTFDEARQERIKKARAERKQWAHAECMSMLFFACATLGFAQDIIDDLAQGERVYPLLLLGLGAMSVCWTIGHTRRWWRLRRG